MISGPVIAMVWEGKEVVATGRKIIGATNPAASDIGTIRGDFAIEVRSVICPYPKMFGRSAIIICHAGACMWAQ